MGSDRRTAESAWTPLSHPVFRALWISSLVSNIRSRPPQWLRNRSELRFGEYRRMRIQSVEVGEVIANTLECLVRSDEKVRVL